jgi:hypothetical protein
MDYLGFGESLVKLLRVVFSHSNSIFNISTFSNIYFGTSQF